jgi:hypothetical protein
MSAALARPRRLACPQEDRMTESADAALAPHPVATQHLPSFITAPGETDVLMVVMAAILALSVLGFGVLFFRLHSLPEHMAHKSQKMQAELVAVLCLISLFTHMHIFWIAGLVLALIELPDFGTPLSRIAGSTEKLAGLKPGEGLVEVPRGPALHAHEPEPPREAPPLAAIEPKPAEGAVATPAKPEAVVPKQRERIHA